MTDDYFGAASSPPQAGPGGPAAPANPWQMGQPARTDLARAPETGASRRGIVAGIAVLGGLLMAVGGWAPWVRLSAFALGSSSVGGLHGGLDGPYLLCMGLAAMLAAGVASMAATAPQVRQLCAGALVVLGLIGLGLVVHQWTTLTDHFRETNRYLSSLATNFPSGSDSTTLSSLLQGIHVSKGWGLTLCGASSAVTALSGVFLLVL